MKAVDQRFRLLFLASWMLLLGVCIQPPTRGSALAAGQPAAPALGVTVKPRDWLKAQTPPNFAPDSTLPPLTRWGWAMSFEVAKELADRWGYAVELADYVSEEVAHEV